MKNEISKGIWTVIMNGTIITGDIEVPHNLRIDGTVVGNIKCSEMLLTGKSSEIKGDCEAQTIRIAGTVTGNSVARNNIFIEGTAVINGNLSTPELAICDGAFFQGSCSMGQNRANAE